MKNILIQLCCLFALLSLSSQASAQNLYQVSLLRAAPGQLPELIKAAQQRKATAQGKMVIMRHSQGDHWDLMLLTPATDSLPQQFSYQHLVDFQHDFLAKSDASWASVAKLSDDTGLFHIEMFQAVNGQYDKLLEQRKMENTYLVATERNANLIFETHFGSDVDMFTLGFYKDLVAFAAEPDLASEVFEKAAVDAGFKARADIGFYLRKFLVGHQDTLASQVK